MEEPSERKPHPRRRYGPEAAAALVPLWEASDRLCGKRLAALLPLLVESLEQHGHLVLEPAVREQVLAMSSATIDRLLAPIRKASGGNNWRRPPRAYSGVRRRVPVRTFKGWDDHHEPGWLEIDLVAHCGGRMQGPFLWTLMATDIATGWSESVPILVRDGAVVLTALQLVRRQLPFPLRGIDADNDPVFMNSLMEAWCARPAIRSCSLDPGPTRAMTRPGWSRRTGCWCAGWWATSGWRAWKQPRCWGSCMGPCGCSPICFSHRSSSKAVSAMAAGSSANTTHPGHRCSG
jgi:hypothetical protein